MKLEPIQIGGFCISLITLIIFTSLITILFIRIKKTLDCQAFFTIVLIEICYLLGLIFWILEVTFTLKEPKSFEKKIIRNDRFYMVYNWIVNYLIECIFFYYIFEMRSVAAFLQSQNYQLNKKKQISIRLLRFLVFGFYSATTITSFSLRIGLLASNTKYTNNKIETAIALFTSLVSLIIMFYMIINLCLLLQFFIKQKTEILIKSGHLLPKFSRLIIFYIGFMILLNIFSIITE